MTFPQRVDRETADEGSVLIIALLMIIVASLLVFPLMSYASTVGRSGRVTHDKDIRVEAVKGGLRVALADPLALYKTCGYTDAANPGAGLNRPVNLAALPMGSVTVNTTCYLLDYALSSEGPTAGRYGITHVEVGSTTPGSLSASEKVYPGSGQANASAWTADATTTPLTDKIWLPRLPAHGLNKRSAAGYVMPSGFPACQVYFPGTYTDDVIITGSTPVYFTSGIYYFEKQFRVSGSANVVVGGGAVEGCTTDQEAAFYAVNAPATHNISGLGATFVFGNQGRLVVDTATAGTGPSLRFNYRYVATTDTSTGPSAGVSIITVNGNADRVNPLDVPGVIYVPLSLVGADPPTAAQAQEYKPSVLIPPAATQTPVVLLNFTTAMSARVEIPGYVAVPQGLVRITTTPGAEANKTVAISGGLLASSFDITGPPPASTVIGLTDPVVQQTFKIVSISSGLPKVTSIAIVQVNQNGAYAVNSWSVQ